MLHYRIIIHTRVIKRHMITFDQLRYNTRMHACLEEMTWMGNISLIQRTHEVIITSLLRQNDVATSFWRSNDAVIIASHVRCVNGILSTVNIFRWIKTSRYIRINNIYQRWHTSQTVASPLIFKYSIHWLTRFVCGVWNLLGYTSCENICCCSYA